MYPLSTVLPTVQPGRRLLVTLLGRVDPRSLVVRDVGSVAGVEVVVDLST